MTTQEIADQLVSLCRQGKYEEAQTTLYADNAVSIEPVGAPLERVEGLDAIKAKAEQWAAMVEEVHAFSTSDPIVAGDFFSMSMENDVTFKGMGRQSISEICVYEVKDGKIVSEQFFYTPAPMG